MKLLSIILAMNPFVDRFIEGGPLFMSLILISLLLSLFFLVRGFLSMNKNLSISKKMTRLASDASLLGLVLGFLGSIIGMITAFDAIEAFDQMNSNIIASGLKVSFLTTVFGAITFIIPRIGILILRSMQKAE
ncbi:MotA/TolQ/ExbB proton channel family protein [Pontimicrobium sp. IMCC45349]|uniref:MotA/TolQ/ExbB proton channel family protein n=1 Tax=Pontimicrobium sp. IMCC45349 TaxID=3391574 RepID=UPI0039A1BD95